LSKEDVSALIKTEVASRLEQHEQQLAAAKKSLTVSRYSTMLLNPTDRTRATLGTGDRSDQKD
jgi:hypothetical protein